MARLWYRLGTRRRLARDEWREPYWVERDGMRVVACRACPKFDSRRGECRISFGSPLRKCVVAATEAHLHGTRGLRVLELGFARRSYPKQVIEASGGEWTGVEPLVDRATPARLGAGGYGHAGAIPFADDTFDVVCGNQSLEHWEEPLPTGEAAPSYGECLAEVWRVLKPGGKLFLDAPIHLHGHEMFIAGDIPRILSLFDSALWRSVTAESWRRDHEPLPRYPTPAADIGYSRGAIKSYDAARIADLQRNGTVWLLTLTAIKRPPKAAGVDARL